MNALAPKRTPRKVHCYACDRARPRKGCHFAAGRYVPVCSDCYPHVKRYLEEVGESVHIKLAQMVISMVRITRIGQRSPEPGEITAIIEALTSPKPFNPSTNRV